jgi:hypothetical protein
MSRWNAVKKIYFIGLPFVSIPTVCVSYVAGINDGLNKTNKINTKYNEMECLFTVIGYTTIYTTVGFVTALTYPVSFPLIAMYTMSKKDP